MFYLVCWCWRGGCGILPLVPPKERCGYLIGRGAWSGVGQRGTHYACNIFLILAILFIVKSRKTKDKILWSCKVKSRKTKDNILLILWNLRTISCWSCEVKSRKTKDNFLLILWSEITENWGQYLVDLVKWNHGKLRTISCWSCEVESRKTKDNILLILWSEITEN